MNGSQAKRVDGQGVAGRQFGAVARAQKKKEERTGKRNDRAGQNSSIGSRMRVLRI